MREYRLIGPPGTGKTRALARTWVPRAVERFGAGAVLVCSLTKAAAREIAGRDLGLPRDRVGTLHSLCYHALGRPTIAEVEVADWNERNPEYALTPHRSAADGGSGDDDAGGGTHGDELMSQAGTLRHRLVPRRGWPPHVESFQRRWERWCEDQGLVDFTGLIEQALEADLPVPHGAHVLVVDECFPAGTPVVTRSGEVPIEDICSAPRSWEVLSSTDGGRTLHWSRVTAAYRTPRIGPLVRVGHEWGEVECTANHPLWVDGKGWVPAGLVSPGDPLRHLRQADGASRPRMLPVVRTDVEREEASTGEGAGEAQEDLRPHARGPQGDPEPDGARGRACEGQQDTEEHRPQAEGPGGKRSRAYALRNATTPSDREALRTWSMAPRVCAPKWKGVQGPRASSALQDRRGEPRAEDRRGGGWKVPRKQPRSVQGRPEGQGADVSRVVRVEVLQPGGLAGRPPMRGRDLRDDVFTLSVESGSYLAGGILVRNCQDLSSLEASLIRRWAEDCDHVVTAGDPLQSIYSFRGSDPAAIFGRKIPEEDQRVLAQSYRVPRAVVDHAYPWVRHRVELLVQADYRPREGDDGALIRSGARLAWPESLRTVFDPDDGRRTMILATCGYMLRRTTAWLRENGIPFWNPYRPTNGAWNPTRGGWRRLRAFLVADPRTVGTDAARLWTWSELRAWTDPLRAQGILAHGAKKLVAEREKAARGTEWASTPLLAAELRQVIEPAAMREVVAALEQGTDRAVAWLIDRCLASRVPTMRYAAEVVRRRGGKALMRDPSIIVGTVHSTKGGESARVILSPDLSPQGQRCAAGAMGRVAKDDVARTFYVGMTRARDELVLLQPSGAGAVTW